MTTVTHIGLLKFRIFNFILHFIFSTTIGINNETESNWKFQDSFLNVFVKIHEFYGRTHILKILWKFHRYDRDCQISYYSGNEIARNVLTNSYARFFELVYVY